MTILSSGIDIGSSAVKVALVRSGAGGGRERADAQVLSCVVERNRRRDQRQVVDLAYERALAEAGLGAEQIDYVATTGEGELVSFRTGHFYGMTAHARGAVFLDAGVRAVLDVGALHARAIKFDGRSKVLDYRMTSQCASGTGQFLENIARYLGVTLDEIGPLSQTAGAPEKVSGICAVLAETDVINMVSRGISTANILRGIHESMAAGFAKLLRSSKVSGTILVTGGLSADTGLIEALSRELSRPGSAPVTLRTQREAVYAGAIGAALWGAYRHERLRSRGLAGAMGAEAKEQA